MLVFVCACVCLERGVWGRIKRIKVTRCNRMALRVCVCVCVCVLEPERTGAPSLAELIKPCEPLQGIFSLSRHAHAHSLTLPPPCTLCSPSATVFA